MKKITKLVLCMAAVGAFGIPVPAAAQGCDAFLGNINKWLVATPQGQIHLHQAGNNAEGMANYVEGAEGTAGSLTYHPAFWASREPAYLQGDMKQYFSTRRYNTTNPSQFGWAPFKADWVDDVGVVIYLGNSPAPPFGSGVKLGQVTFTLYSWGNVQMSMQGLCQSSGSYYPDGMLHGLIYGLLGDSVQAITLEEYIEPVTK